jgi:hypothetical protein
MYSIQNTLFDINDYAISSEEASNDNSRIGATSELAFALKVHALGFDIYSPWGHAQKTDLIIRKPLSRPLSIQIKKATAKSNETWQVSTSTKKRTANGVIWNNYKIGDFDILAAHILELDCWSLWRIEDIAGKSSIHWHKYSTHRNNFDLLESK